MVFRLCQRMERGGRPWGGRKSSPKKINQRESLPNKYHFPPQKNSHFFWEYVEFRTPVHPHFLKRLMLRRGEEARSSFFRTRFRTTKIGPDFAFSFLKKKCFQAGKRDYRCLKKAAAGTIAHSKRRMGKGNIVRTNLLWESWVFTLFFLEK